MTDLFYFANPAFRRFNLTHLDTCKSFIKLLGYRAHFLHTRWEANLLTVVYNLGLKVEQREVYFDEVKDFAECGLCGTAAVISPVGKIVNHGEEICFPSGMEEMGPVTKKLYETLSVQP